jgi:hypothetical protein
VFFLFFSLSQPASIVVKTVPVAGSREQSLFNDVEFRREKPAGKNEVVYSLKSSIKKSTYTVTLNILNNKPKRTYHHHHRLWM